jgi:hypothetical protein
MPLDDRQTYLDILQHADAYLTSFDQKSESAYLTSLEESRSGCRTDGWQRLHYRLPKWFAEQVGVGEPCSVLFAQFDTYGMENPYRKAETFLYRRIVNDHWRKGDVRDVLRRVIADLAPLA